MLTSWSLTSTYMIIKSVRKVSIIKYTEEEFNHKRNLGKRIVELRHIFGITQEELADRIRIAPRSLSEIENGKCSPNAIIIYRIAKVLNISLNDFYSFHEITNDTLIKDHSD